MFNQGFGFQFIPSNPGETEGLEEIDQWMRYDIREPHCFDPTKMGYTRFHVLCPDDTSAVPQIINGQKVYPPAPFPNVITPDNLHDSDLFRYQMCNRSYAPAEVHKYGETIDKMFKADDDFGQALQMVAIKKLLANIPLTNEEYIEETLPQGLTMAAIEEIDS